MFHPPQAAIGLALLPVAWAAEERARAERGGLSQARERDVDLARYFAPGWQRDTVPHWPVAMPSRSAAADGVAAQAQRAAYWRGWRLSWRGVVRRVKGLVLGFSRG